MIRAIPDLAIGQVRPGRLKGLYGRLTEAVDGDLFRLPRPTVLELLRIDKSVQEFAKTTGWQNKQRHIMTLVSFCLAMIEHSEFQYSQRITKNLSEIVEYFERERMQNINASGPEIWPGKSGRKYWRRHESKNRSISKRQEK